MDLCDLLFIFIGKVGLAYRQDFSANVVNCEFCLVRLPLDTFEFDYFLVDDDLLVGNLVDPHFFCLEYFDAVLLLLLLLVLVHDSQVVSLRVVEQLQVS